MKFGVQTFTIRKAQKKSITKAYLPLIEQGIDNFEVARIKFSAGNAKEIKELVDKHGIEISSIQVKPKYVFGDVDGVVRFCNMTGCKNVVISMLPFRCILGSEQEFYRFVDSLDRQCEIYAERGITLAYHHHNWEYVKVSNGRTRMAEILARTNKIMFVHDTYWTARCGIDPALQIAEFGNRLLGIHLRDLTFNKKFIDVVPTDTVVGQGVIDFKRVISAASYVGCSYMVIEQKTDTPYEDIKQSYTYLKKISSH